MVLNKGKSACRSPKNIECYRSPVRYPPVSQADCADGCKFINAPGKTPHCMKIRSSGGKGRCPRNPDCYVDPVSDHYPPTSEADCKSPCQLVKSKRGWYCSNTSRRSSKSSSSCPSKKRVSPFPRRQTSARPEAPKIKVSGVDPQVAELMNYL